MKFLKLPAALLAVLSFTSAAYPSDLPTDLIGLKITSIMLKDDRGNPWPNPGEVMPLLVVKQGEPFSLSDEQEGLQYLYLTGRFKDVIVNGFREDGGVRLEYTLVPVTIVEKVVVEGNHTLTSKQIDETLIGVEGGEYREDKLPDIKANLLSLYQTEGYYHAAVTFRAEPARQPHQVILHIGIDEGEPTLIKQITFSGNTVFTDEQLLKTIKSKVGKPIRRDVLLDADMRAILEKYSKAGYPAAKPGPVSVSFSDNSAYVYIPGSEGPKVTVSLTGNHEFGSGTLKNSLLIWTEHDVSDSAIEGSIEKIKDLYREQGYADVKVEVKKTEGPGRLDLLFKLTEGPRITVKDIIIKGNTYFTAKQLKRQMNLRESGFFKSRPYREDLLDKDVDYIKDLYVDAGFLSVSVKSKISIVDKGRKAVVFIDITEGPQTKVDSITFEGNKAFTDSELLGMLHLKPGAPFSERVVDEDRYRILSAYSNKGYLYAKVEAEKTAVDDKEDIRYKIAEDIQVKIGRIILRGNRSTKDYVIMRELKIKPGEPYNYEAILKSQQRIYKLGYFGIVRFEPLQPGEKEPTKDMLLTVEERPAGAVDVGFGYGDLDRLRGFVEISHRNLWGTARYASLRFEESDIVKRVIFNFQEPWFLGHDLQSRLSLVWSDTKTINSDTREIYYQTRRTALSETVEKTYNGFKPYLTYQLENVENYNVKPGAIISPEDIGHVLISSITPGLIYDMRDDPFNPHHGSLHGVAVKEALKELESQAVFTKLTVQSSWYFPFRASVVALSGRAGWAWPRWDTPEVPLTERFKLGGSTTVRGYTQDSIGPVGADGTPQGGDSMVVFNAELRIPIAGSFGLVLFTDAGNVWKDQAIRINDLRSSYGAGIRYNTPIGPLRIDYGQKIHRLPGESPGELHFNIGHTF